MGTFHGIQLLGIHDVGIKNLTVTSSWNKFPHTPVTSGKNPGRGGLTYAVSMVYAAGADIAYNITIDNELVERFRRRGVCIYRGSRDTVVKKSLARNATGVGDGGAGYGFVIQGAGHNRAETNPYLGQDANDTYFALLENNRTEGPYIRHAALVQYWAHNNLITRNVFEDTQLEAIDLHGEDEYANEVSYNTARAARWAGIGLGNSGAGNDKTSVDNWIHHNVLIGCAWEITLQYGPRRSTIEHNTIRDNTSLAQAPVGSVILGSSSESVLRNNVLSGNTVPGFSAIMPQDDAAEGEEPAGCPRNWLITGNKVSTAGRP